jgi:predicted small lipoprotein YifL
MSPLKFLLAATLITCCLAACGQKGPLYLPEASGPPPAERNGAPEEEDEERKKDGENETYQGNS